MELRNCSIGIFFIGTPSRRISPVFISQRRTRILIIVVFPAPVKPTIAAISPGFTEKSSPFKTSSPSL
jgi:hypothetical protein